MTAKVRRRADSAATAPALGARTGAVIAHPSGRVAGATRGTSTPELNGGPAALLLLAGAGDTKSTGRVDRRLRPAPSNPSVSTTCIPRRPCPPGRRTRL